MIAVCEISEGRDTERLAAIHDACCVGRTAIMTLAVVPELDRAVVTLIGRPDELVEGIAIGALIAVRGFDRARFVWLTDREREVATAAVRTLAEMPIPPAAAAVPPFVLLALDAGDRWIVADGPAHAGIAAGLLEEIGPVRAARLLAPCPAGAFDGWPDDVPCEHRSWAAL